ncbi:ParA family protein [Nocardia asteroides]|uniref:ParA family protein n=1 Tax=Nocardia asteroides TaxID=1824 RepID=UPI001E6220B3|nr:hypothetical protein [Nocardia asteroides]UGT58913.1 hypothetical protein LTT85_33030 [Nocardia asteroides]
MTNSQTPTRLVYFGVGGSSAKTSQAVNQACEYARRGLRVRFWDGDNQGDGSTYFHYMEPPTVIGEVLARKETIDDETSPSGKRVASMREIELPIFRSTAEEAEALGGLAAEEADQEEWLQRLTIVPSGIGATGITLNDAITEMARDVLGPENALAAIESIDADRGDADRPDIEIFDLPGMVGPLHYLALKWAARGGTKGGRSGVVLVVTPDDKSMGKHFWDALAKIKSVSAHYPIETVAIMPTRVSSNRGKFYVEMYETFKGNPQLENLVTPPVRETVQVPESFGVRQPLLLYVPNERVTEDQTAIADWLKERGVIAA